MHFYLHVVSCQRKDVGVLSHSSEGKKECLCLDLPCFRLDTLCQMCLVWAGSCSSFSACYRQCWKLYKMFRNDVLQQWYRYMHMTFSVPENWHANWRQEPKRKGCLRVLGRWGQGDLPCCILLTVAAAGRHLPRVSHVPRGSS